MVFYSIKGYSVNKSILDQKLIVTGSSNNIKLRELKGQNIVLYFYPKDNTPGCIVEGKDFNRLYKQFSTNNTEVFGVSMDSLNSHEKFKSKFKFTFELISDLKGELCKTFKVLKEKSMFGKKFTGIERSTFVLDQKGRLINEWRKVQTLGHAKEVLKFVKQL